MFGFNSGANIAKINQLNDKIVGSFNVIKAGDVLYIRTPWDNAYDLVQTMTFERVPSDTTNEVVEFGTISLVLKSVADKDVPTASMLEVKTAIDDICPQYYNGTYIGANHGANYIVSITANSHGKAVEDVGSQWIDSDNHVFTIMKVIDNNTIWVMSENQSIDGTWSFLKSISGSSLTHSAGATNTATINFTAQTTTQLRPATKNNTQKIIINGKTELIDNGVYDCNFIQIVDAYDIINVEDVLTFVKSQVGGNVQPAFDDNSIDVDARVTNVYTYQSNGACVVSSNLFAYNKLKITYIGFIQSMPVKIPSGGTIYQYVPDSIEFTIGENSYNFAEVQDITNIADSINLINTRWVSANYPPNRFLQYAKTSEGVKNSRFGFMTGYCPEIGVGVPLTRKSSTVSAMMIATTKKYYPYGVSENSSLYDDFIPANTNMDMVSFRCPVNYGYDGDATNISWYQVGSDIYLMLDYHTNITKTLQLPESLLNKNITVVKKTDSFTLLSSYIGYDGVRFTVADNYGYAVLKLTDIIDAPDESGTGEWAAMTLLNEATGDLYYRKYQNRLEFRGYISQSSVVGAPFVLPVGYRPSYAIRIPIAASDGTAGTLLIGSDGIAYQSSAMAGKTTYLDYASIYIS